MFMFYFYGIFAVIMMLAADKFEKENVTPDKDGLYIVKFFLVGLPLIIGVVFMSPAIIMLAVIIVVSKIFITTVLKKI